MTIIPPLTIPTIFQPLIQAWVAWFTTTFVSLPISTFLVWWDVPRCMFGFLFKERPKVILITGADTNIGEKFALEYAQLGNTLGLLSSDKYKLDRLANECNKRGAQALSLHCDISNLELLRETVEEFINERPIDLLVANISQNDIIQDGETRWEDMFEQVIVTNINGIIGVIMSTYKRMQDKGKGQIAIVNPTASHFSIPQMIYHNMTKSALLSFSRDFRYLARRHNINVSIISPGLIDTPITTKALLPISNFRFFFASSNSLAFITKIQLQQGNFEITWPFLEMLPAYAYQTLPPRILNTITDFVGVISDFVAGIDGAWV
ncbi:4724_t:CDS:2 [Dentiscutata erythropus]|uniref:4724_t:CDS:1 n=1 Tax=Dentiscutata erythropus TaxID=1348616 RepID=A0A9N9J9L7_9GLOM|nr:4724_t:CDS:2 [Dentiscutata erythropus]